MAELSEKTLFLGMKNHDFQQILRNFFCRLFLCQKQAVFISY